MGGLVGFGREVRLCWILRRGRGDGQSQRSRLGSDQGGWNLRIAGSCPAGNRKGSRAGIALQTSAACKLVLLSAGALRGILQEDTTIPNAKRQLFFCSVLNFWIAKAEFWYDDHARTMTVRQPACLPGL